MRSSRQSLATFNLPERMSFTFFFPIYFLLFQYVLDVFLFFFAIGIDDLFCDSSFTSNMC